MQEKIAKFELDQTIKVLDGCNSILESFYKVDAYFNQMIIFILIQTIIHEKKSKLIFFIKINFIAVHILFIEQICS